MVTFLHFTCVSTHAFVMTLDCHNDVTVAFRDAILTVGFDGVGLYHSIAMSTSKSFSNVDEQFPQF
jgi:hypothetical protein